MVVEAGISSAAEVNGEAVVNPVDLKNYTLKITSED